MIVGAVSILIGIITFIRVTYRQKQVVNLTEKIEIVQNKIMEENKVVKIFEDDEADRKTEVMEIEALNKIQSILTELKKEIENKK